MKIFTSVYMLLTKYLTNKTAKFMFLVLCCLSTNVIKAQPGTIDTSFNPADTGFANGDGSNSEINSIAVQNDGKMIVGGLFTNYNGSLVNCIARLNVDGSLDTTFNIGLGATSGIGFTAVKSVVLQADGKVLIGGNFNSYNGTTRNNIARLNIDGSIDTTFNPGSGVYGSVNSIAIQSNGKILIGGDFTYCCGIARNNIARLNTDGSLDVTFNPGVNFVGSILSIAIQGNDKVLIGGGFTYYHYNNNTVTLFNRIARLNTDGSLDATFSTGNGADNGISSIVIQGDGKVLIGGNFSTYNGTIRKKIARLNVDGSLDATFNPGTGANAIIRTILVQGDGKVLVGGDFTNFNSTEINHIARLNTDGNLDTTFNPGTGNINNIYSIAVQLDGKVIICGSFTISNGIEEKNIARLKVNGSLDTTFSPGTGADATVRSVVVQLDGKVLIGGWFNNFNGNERNYIARLNADGSLDTTFNPGIGPNSYINSIAVQVDGKILIGGGFTSFNGTDRNGIARLNVDGSLDTTFNPGLGSNNGMGPIVLQVDGKVLIGGGFTNFNGTEINSIARLNSDGSLDATFNPGIGPNSAVNSIAVQGDGKVLIGGNFTSYNGIGRNCIARLNTNGSLDITYNPGTGVNGNSPYINSIALQGDGKLLIGGWFNAYNGTVRNCIARLHTNGSLDTAFNPIISASNPINSIAIQGDGKVLIGGWDLIALKGTIERLNTNGSIDNAFNPGTGPNSYVNSIALQVNGKALIGGVFTNFNGTGKNRIARINGDEVLSNETWSETNWVNAYPNPFIENFNLDISTPSQHNISIKVYDLTGRMLEAFVLPGWNLQSLKLGSIYPKGVYTILVNQAKNLKILRVIKQ